MDKRSIKSSGKGHGGCGHSHGVPGFFEWLAEAKEVYEYELADLPRHQVFSLWVEYVSTHFGEGAEVGNMAQQMFIHCYDQKAFHKLDALSAKLAQQFPPKDDGLSTANWKDVWADEWSMMQASQKCVVHDVKDIDAIYLNDHFTPGLPALAVLKALVGKARGLVIVYAKGKGLGVGGSGIYFVISECTVQNNIITTTVEKRNELVFKKGTTGCYENEFLPLKNVTEKLYLIVHQSLAPCQQCRNGFRLWAMQRNCAIIVVFDNPYDKSLNSGCFVFSATGNVFQFK